MASSSGDHEEVPFHDEGIIEAMCVNFEDSANFLDLEYGINLLGILITDEEPGLGGIKATLMGIWKTLGHIRIIRVKKNTYCLTVGSEKLAAKLIDDSPWNIKGYYFSVRHWLRYHSIDDIDASRAVYWIQGHGVPLDQLTLNNGRKLGNVLGSVIEVEDPLTTGNRGYLRMRVDFDTRNPLATFVNLPKPNSSLSKIGLQYEQLKNFYYNCGRFGHMLSSLVSCICWDSGKVQCNLSTKGCVPEPCFKFCFELSLRILVGKCFETNLFCFLEPDPFSSWKQRLVSPATRDEQGQC